MGQDDDVIAFFAAMPEARRREYEALAELDRRFGEDVAAERRERGARTAPDRSRGGS